MRLTPGVSCKTWPDSEISQDLLISRRKRGFAKIICKAETNFLTRFHRNLKDNAKIWMIPDLSSNIWTESENVPSLAQLGPKTQLSEMYLRTSQIQLY